MNIQTLIDRLAVEDEAGRLYAVEDLGHANAAEAITPLIERLPAETSRKVRETIFTALERIEHPEVCLQVARLLDSDDAFLRNQAVNLLQRKGAASAKVLLARMSDPDPDVRKFVLDTAAGIAAPAVEPIFDAAIHDQDANVVIAALEYLGDQRKTRFKSEVEWIFLHAKEPMLGCAAFAALLQIGDAISWQCIRQRYATPASVPSWELGWWIRALGNFGQAGDLEIFHEILLTHDGKVVCDTIDALERFQARHGRREITEDFWQLLRTRLQANLSSEDKLQTLRVIGGFGAPKATGEYLFTLLEQKDQVTKLGAIEGIKRLNQPELLERLQQWKKTESDSEVCEAIGDGGKIT